MLRGVQETEQLGLREIKRRETRFALESATIDLVLEVGLENVTVEQIAERAHVSPRTFFNYFSSKEEALLGDAMAELSEELAERFANKPSGKGVYADLRELFLAHMAGSASSRRLFERRMQAVTASPHLMRQQMTRFTAMTEDLTMLVARRLESEAGASSEQPSSKAVSEARALVLVCAAAVQLSFQECRGESAVNDPAQSLRSAFELLETVKDKYL